MSDPTPDVIGFRVAAWQLPPVIHYGLGGNSRSRVSGHEFKTVGTFDEIVPLTNAWVYVFERDGEKIRWIREVWVDEHNLCWKVLEAGMRQTSSKSAARQTCFQAAPIPHGLTPATHSRNISTC